MIAVLLVVFKIRTKVFLESAKEFPRNTPFCISWFGINIYQVAEFIAIFRTTLDLAGRIVKLFSSVCFIGI